MTEMIMCPGRDCPQRDTCYRYTAKPLPHWQAYFCDSPHWRNGTCEYYWPVLSESREKKEET